VFLSQEDYQISAFHIHSRRMTESIDARALLDMLEESAQVQTSFFSNESERTSGIWGGVQEHDAGRQGVFAN
jgi:hypothetical protein